MFSFRILHSARCWAVAIPIVASSSGFFENDRANSINPFSSSTKYSYSEEQQLRPVVRDKEFIIIAGTASKKIANEICNELGVRLSSADMERFSDGEIFVRFNESLREKDVFIVQTCAPPVNDNVMELLLSIAAAKRSGGIICTFLSYFMYFNNRLFKSSQSIIGDCCHTVLWIQAQSPRITNFNNPSQSLSVERCGRRGEDASDSWSRQSHLR